jgi:Ca-activated chloride channel homolog
MNHPLSLAWSAFAVMLFAGSALGQGVLIVINPPHPVPLPRPRPRAVPSPPPMSYKIKELDYHAKITDQVAQVAVTQSFVNTGSRQMEVAFVFPIPYDSAIDRMTFMVDGKEYDAKLLDAKEARQTYEEHVRKSQDPALLEWVGHGMLRTSVFPVPPGAERKVSLKFSQLLRKDGKLTDLIIPLSTAKYTSSPVEKLSIHVAIETAQELKSVYSPTHAVNIERSDKRHAVVKIEANDTVPTTDFRLLFDTADGQLGASLISYRPESGEEGYFLLLASPEIKAANDERTAKTVIFVVDRSGSMSGKKIEQAKEAAKFVLNNLRQGDTFNILAYDSTVESFRPELQKYDEESRQAALGFVAGLYPGGSTNIDGALSTSLAMIKDESRPNFLLFLTDGLPTVGERNEAKIAATAKQNNKLRTRMINFGVGYDVNSRLLDRLSRENFGQSEYVRPDESIEAHVSSVYNKLSAPVMTNVTVKVDIEGAASESGSVSRVYPKDVYDLFAGEQLILVGRYKQAGSAKITITGKTGGKEQKFDFPATFVEKSSDQSHAFVEKLWVMRRIGQIIDEIDLHGKNDELVKELVGLSTKHGILTPYTSFLADETAPVRDLADVRLHLERAGRGLERLREAEGIAGVAQRSEKFNFQSAQLAPASSAPAFGGTAAARVPSRSAKAGGVPALSAVGGYGGFDGGMPGGRGGNVYRDIDSDKSIAADGVQNAGKETLYRRGNQWIANNAKDLDLAKDMAKIQEVKRFSEEYFALVRANTADENAILATQQAGEDLLVRFRGQAYLVK